MLFPRCFVTLQQHIHVVAAKYNASLALALHHLLGVFGSGVVGSGVVSSGLVSRGVVSIYPKRKQ